MHNHTVTLVLSSLMISLLTGVCASSGDRPVPPGIEEVEINGTPVPKEMHTAYKDLDHMLSPAIKTEIAEGTEEALAKYHRELAGWIRNNWGTRRNSDLRRWFRAGGIDNPEDISAIILKSYRRYLRDEPLGLDALVKDYALK